MGGSWGTSTRTGRTCKQQPDTQVLNPLAKRQQCQPLPHCVATLVTSLQKLDTTFAITAMADEKASDPTQLYIFYLQFVRLVSVIVDFRITLMTSPSRHWGHFSQLPPVLRAASYRLNKAHCAQQTACFSPLIVFNASGTCAMSHGTHQCLVLSLL